MFEGTVGEKGEMGDTGPPGVQGLSALGDRVSCNCYTLAIHLCFTNVYVNCCSVFSQMI